MFKIEVSKNGNSGTYTVFDVLHRGMNVYFLIFINDEWKFIDSNHCVPISE